MSPTLEEFHRGRDLPVEYRLQRALRSLGVLAMYLRAQLAGSVYPPRVAKDGALQPRSKSPKGC